MQQHCINRVNRELVDCINLPCVAVNSLSQLVWHVNIFSPPIQKDGIAKENESTTLPSLHLVVSFPENYPLCPPACYITTPYKHINVNQNEDTAHGGVFKICLDMLDATSNTTTKYDGWSPAIKVSGILCQIQSSLMDRSLVTGDLTDCIAACRDYTCEECGHTFDNPQPNVKTSCQNSAMPSIFDMPAVSRITCFDNKPTRRAFKTVEMETKQQETKQQETKHASNTTENKVVCVDDEEHGWTTIPSTKTKTKTKTLVKKSTGTNKLPSSTSTSTCLKSFNALKGANGLKSRGTAKVTKASLKNRRRRERKRLEKLALTTLALTTNSIVTETKSTETKQEQEQEQEMKTNQQASTVFLVARKNKDYHVLERLPSHLLVYILGFTDVHDVQSLSCVSLRCRKISTDGFMWRQLFIRTVGSTVTVTQTADWRRLFDLHRTTCVSSSLKCYFTQAGFTEDVLGVPLDFTRNPRTNLTDYVSVSCDSLLSKTAFHEHGIRKTAWNKPSLCLLPLYLSEEHFQRALPMIKRTIAQVSGMVGYSGIKSQDSFRPCMVLDVIPQAMKTLTLLIATKADIVCDSVADTFVQLHRLMVALIQEYPQLRIEVRNRLKSFIRGGSYERSKESVPSLGDLFPLLSVCPEFKFTDLVRPYFMENLDRGVLWSFRTFPELAKRSRTICNVADKELLHKSFEARVTSLRLLLINKSIYDCLLRPNSLSIADTCQKVDYLLGHATPSAKSLFVQNVSEALTLDDWGKFLTKSGLRLHNGALPSPVTLTNWLKKSADNSEYRGYHKRGMNFSKVHKSGGSRLLRKGEGQDLGAVSKIKLNDSWRWDDGNSMFLDASVLLFDFKGKHKDTVDYSKTNCRGMIHSGDRMDHANSKGTHTVDIELHRLDRHVQSVVIVLSAFNEATMEQAKLPNVSVVDQDSGAELCRYELEAKTANLQGMKNVIMCRIWRQEHGAAWRVDAVGAVGAFGDATNYQPIINELEATYKPDPKPVVLWKRGVKK